MATHNYVGSRIIKSIALASCFASIIYIITLDFSDNPYVVPVLVNAIFFISLLLSSERRSNSMLPITLALIVATVYLTFYKLQYGVFLYPQSVDALLYQSVARQIIAEVSLNPLLTSQLSPEDYAVILYILPFFGIADSAFPVYIMNVLLLHSTAQRLLKSLGAAGDSLQVRFFWLIPINPLFLYAALTGFKEALLIWATVGLILSMNKRALKSGSLYCLIIQGLRPTVAIILIAGFLLPYFTVNARIALGKNRIKKAFFVACIIASAVIGYGYPLVASMAERSLLAVSYRYMEEPSLQQFSIATSVGLSLVSASVGPSLAAFQSSSAMTSMYGVGAIFHVFFVAGVVVRLAFNSRGSEWQRTINWRVLVIVLIAVLGIGGALRGFDPRFMLSFYVLYPLITTRNFLPLRERLNAIRS